eukprot:TRINITY_DN41284_c0_g1_i1.p1 TRINITY_DN41284_c0_g1~~TRINITY_DN41284_c0_g1_i1.p1  ORF type:complete len:465 (+),score=76.20 TRINITY_DN41284_c0_g1_i1:44-1438(+)
MAEREHAHEIQENLAGPHVAIIGGGVTGAVCARELLRKSAGRVQVTVFDQGRGLGGRTSHRRIEMDGDYTLPTAANVAYAFDHGCQFFRADSTRFKEELLQDWLSRSLVAEWQGDFGALAASPDGSSPADFFGFPSKPPFYCGVGGMSSLACGLLADARASGALVREGVRVAGTTRLSSGRWLLSGTSGRAAFHDTAEEEAARASPDSLGEFDAVVVTDVSASMAGWHRASAGIPEEVASQVRNRTRVAIFTALVAFETPLQLEKCAFSAADDTLWFAARTASKPGLKDVAQFDCWTFVSTPKYAAAEIERVPMQDPVTGAFRPQDMSYLREGPSATLLAAFEKLLATNGYGSALPLPKIAYVGGQRWGSAFPAPASVEGRDEVGRGQTTVDVLSCAYESASSLPLVPPDAGDSAAAGARNYLADDSQCIFYASDYVSKRVPGMESAALSGLDVARHVADVLCR